MSRLVTPPKPQPTPERPLEKQSEVVLQYVQELTKESHVSGLVADVAGLHGFLTRALAEGAEYYISLRELHDKNGRICFTALKDREETLDEYQYRVDREDRSSRIEKEALEGSKQRAIKDLHCYAEQLGEEYIVTKKGEE